MRVQDLKPNPRNPRKISDQKLEMLKKAMREFGDLGGIVFNRRTKQLIGGHQRNKVFTPETEIQAYVVLNEPTPTGTIAEGYIEFEGERFSYREVDWDENKEKAANIAANKGAGEFDLTILSDWVIDLDTNNFDLDLTMFDQNEIEDLLSPIEEDHKKIEEIILNPEQLSLINAAWSQWCSEQLINLSLLEKEKVFFQSLTPASLKIYFLRSLFMKKEFPRFATTARQYHRMLCSGDGKNGSIIDLFNKTIDDQNLSARLRFALGEKPSFEKIASISGLPMAGHKAPVDFPVDLAKDLYNEFAKNGSVLDPCHGWGGRFIGFLLSEAQSYFGIDASPLTNQGLIEISEDLKQYHNKESKLICSPFEDCELKENEFDFALTSPPYFDRETYLGGDQAHTRYKTYEDFIKGFYTQLISKTYNSLKNNSFFALQIGNQKYDLDKKALSLAKDIGFQFLEMRQTEMKSMGSDEDEEAKEVILIFKKHI